MGSGSTTSRNLWVTTTVAALFTSLALAQAPATDAPGGVTAPAGPRGGARAAGAPTVDPNTPTEEQWNKPDVQAYVAKARMLAGDDPDLRYDASFNCTAAGTHALGGGAAVMTIGDGAYLQDSQPKIPFVAMPPKTTMLPAQRLFDDFWRFGGTGVGAWLITSKDGYILFDTLDTAQEARANLVAEMEKNHLDPKKIRYIVFGHWHADHTGGGHFMQQLTGARVFMGRDDWKLYARMFSDGGRAVARMDDKTPMSRGEDATDGMKLTVGDTTVTFIAMPGHTPGSVGMILPVRFHGKKHNILVVTASAGGDNVRNRETLIGGFEHIWDWGIREKVESVLNAHVNYNINTLSRQAYIAENYATAKVNPLLYGVEKTRRYIDITRACAQARLEALGW